MVSEIEEIEAILREHLKPRETNGFPYVSGVSKAAAAIAALRSKDREDGARPDIAEALKREAQEQHFRRELAESTYARLKDQICRAAHKAFAGDDRALRRLVDTIENPKPIYGSGEPAGRLALAEQEARDA